MPRCSWAETTLGQGSCQATHTEEGKWEATAGFSGLFLVGAPSRRKWTVAAHCGEWCADLEAVTFCWGGENAQNEKEAHSMTKEASGVLFKRRLILLGSRRM